jgi:hypothetical protein
MGAPYDSKTIKLIRSALAKAWGSFTPAEQAEKRQSDLGGRILASVAQGERDPLKLEEAALQTEKSNNRQ